MQAIANRVTVRRRGTDITVMASNGQAQATLATPLLRADERSRREKTVKNVEEGQMNSASSSSPRARRDRVPRMPRSVLMAARTPARMAAPSRAGMPTAV